MVIINLKNNILIKRFRSFKTRISPKEKEFFCIEGSHLLEELLKSGHTPERVIATEEWMLKYKSLAKMLDQSILSIISVEALASCVSTKNPDGVAAIVRKDSIPVFSLHSDDDLILVLDRIQDPGNLGSLFRTALAAGVNKIILGGGANPLNPKVLRSSCGAIFKLPFLRFEGNEKEIVENLLIFLSKISKKGFQIVSTSQQGESSNDTIKPYWELNWSERTAVILGNEGSGIHYKIKKAFTDTITIPHSELVESLNVACVAVPLLLERKRVALTNSDLKFKSD